MKQRGIFGGSTVMFPVDYPAFSSPLGAMPLAGTTFSSAASAWRKSVPYAQMPAFLLTSDPWIEDYGRHMISGNSVQEEATDKLAKEPTLPKDPRLWSRDDVAKWVQHVTALHHLPSVQLDRFLMNGKALCLMTIEMFVSRVPLGGKLLYKDFQLRLSSALYS